MTEPVIDAVAIGVAAWSRLRDHDRASWNDWLSVARALPVGRTAALKIAGTNQPVGSKYNAAMGAWLQEHGLADIVAQERYRLFLILQNLDAVETWRAGLDEGQRRRLNHPLHETRCWRVVPGPSRCSLPRAR
ncbi:hypothetical protein SAMN05444170_6669 [Bradyrhizobium erythrophlei]|uniref:Uncharacterized protein n=1 Tax=Bradyrhizobium erythrophlei TaxID=1437360 RepID=A0A1M7UU31_9BRAD|nr:hypothetical protein SAMN05444170_6669 [Bradyrhizobium erythrophlei]